ncbi:MFS transporter [Nocardia blacklockiae]|uniref:MFS transporter n=1 Tax=Nocardia blacklockiae TaxID=480036 RepID=UPI0018935EC6|nr:MFS transporter [Nocardia blacklockiae]MBF6175142.1 MFS transporter [Nocardia blacklockiae]
MDTGGYTPVSSVRAARTANAVAFGLQGFFLAVVLTELPQQRDRFGLDDTEILLATVLISVLAAAGSVLAERLALRWSSRTALRAGLALIGLTGAGIAVAPQLAVLFVALAGYGVAVGLVDASTNMQAVFIQHGYGKVVLSSFYAAWSAGAILGALFVSGCEALDVSLPVAVLSAAALVLAGGLAFGPRLLGTRQAEAEPEEAAAAESVPLRAYLAIGVAMALVFAVDLAVGNWSALYLRDDLKSSSATAALALAAYQGASLAGRLTGDLWVRRFGPRAVVRVAATIGTLGLALVVAAPGPAVAIAGFLVAGIGLPVIAPLCFSEAGRLTGGRGLDALIARLNLFNYVGTLVGGGVVGGVADATDRRIAYLLPVAFGLALIASARYFQPHPSAGKPSAPAPGRAVLEE